MGRTHGAQTPVGRWTARERGVVAVVGLLLAVLLVTTADGGLAQSNDTRAAALASWSLGTQGELALPEPWPASHNYWGVETADGRVHVNRFPGVASWAAPAYALTARIDPASTTPAHPFLVDLRPAAATAALTVLAAGLVAYALLRRRVGPRAAGVATVTLLLGTSLWPVAADALWPHGPTALGLLLALWGADAAGGDHPAASALAPGTARAEAITLARGAAPAAAAALLAVAVGVAVALSARPHLVVAVAVAAGGGAWACRTPAGRARWGAVSLAAAGGGAVGLGVVAAYSAAVFGTWLPVAGYHVAGHLGGLASHGADQTVSAVVGVLVGERGVLRFSPVVAVALAAAFTHRRTVPVWSWVVAAAGLAYLLVQVRAVGPLGGTGFFGPRVTTETVVLAAPALTVGALAAVRSSRWWLGAVALAAVVSVAINAFGAVRGGTDPSEAARWERVETSVQEAFGDLELGDVDLRDRPGDDPAATHDRSTS